MPRKLDTLQVKDTGAAQIQKKRALYGELDLPFSGIRNFKIPMDLGEKSQICIFIATVADDGS